MKELRRPSAVPVLEIRDLRLELQNGRKPALPVVEDVSLRVNKGEIVGIVGESGCGKSILSLSVLGLLPPAIRVAGGAIHNQAGQALNQLGDHEIRRIRGKEIAMIFQDPMSSLNPSLTVGRQVAEAIRLHEGCSRREAEERTVAMFRKVGLPRPEALLAEYPHRLSGGMRQRIMIAMAVSCRPQLLIADEPTTALDVTIQAQILALMRKLREEDGTSILLISHDLGLISGICDRVLVMYAGRIVEQGPAAEVLRHPSHPYTAGLLASIPLPSKKGSPLTPIAGHVPALHERGEGCLFASRCNYATERCRREVPAFWSAGAGHDAACHLFAEEEGGRLYARG
jgi:peptide/nickel transport system ATP-binding protein